jgi:hypothetical protein
MVLNKGQADLIRNNKSAINTGGINVQMTVNIAKAGDQEVLVLLDKFKQAVATDKDLSELGRY